jgi:hypothetical protein
LVVSNKEFPRTCTHCNRSLIAQDEVGPTTIQLLVLELPTVADFVQAAT